MTKIDKNLAAPTDSPEENKPAVEPEDDMELRVVRTRLKLRADLKAGGTTLTDTKFLE